MGRGISGGGEKENQARRSGAERFLHIKLAASIGVKASVKIITTFEDDTST